MEKQNTKGQQSNRKKKKWTKKDAIINETKNVRKNSTKGDDDSERRYKTKVESANFAKYKK